VPAEPAQLPREHNQGRDELNLAEFPLAALSSRVSPAKKTLVFQDRIRDRGNGEFITRRLIITASDRYGLPTAIDDDIIVGLIQLTKANNNFTDRVVSFSRYALVALLGWPDSGQSYRRIEESLKRWLGVTLTYERAWWDKESQSWIDEHFHIIDNVTLVHQETRRRKAACRQRDLPLSSFSWNTVVFRSFRAENLKRLDLNLYFQLSLAPAKRALRFLDKRFYRRNRLEFDLRNFACEHVGLSRKYDVGKIKEKLQPSLEELEKANFIEPLQRDERYVKVGAGVWRIIFVRKSGDSPPRPTRTASSTHEQELIARGVTPATAKKLVTTYPPERIGSKIEVHDWLRANNGQRLSKNPAGYLVHSIRNDYAPPAGFASKADREKMTRARHRKRSQVAERLARRKAEADARLDAQKDPILRYWNSLSPAEQERVRDAALADADSWLLERYEGAKPHLAKHFLQIIIDRYIEKQALAHSAE
jgi:hypothetical protein